MDKHDQLAEATLKARLAEVPKWSLRNDRKAIVRTFEMQDFVFAFGFMTSVALLAERMGHHPDWQNAYNRVAISLSTHDADGLTEKDFELASQIDAICPSAR
jgi:4a-hydroxytetrahydrobiopterin dehydratase